MEGGTKFNTIYKDKRNKVLTNVTYGIVSLLKLYYRISYENKENLESLKDKPFIILAEHERYFDIPIFDFLIRKYLGKHGYFIMRSNLPKWLLEPTGGIYVVRGKDLRKRKISKDEAKERNDYVYNTIIPYLSQNNKIIVMYAGRTRNRYRKVTKIRKSVLETLLQIPTTFVVVGIKYKNVQTPFSKVTLKISKPFQADNLETIMDNISTTFTKKVEFI